jgi:hypothetical protein
MSKIIVQITDRAFRLTRASPDLRVKMKRPFITDRFRTRIRSSEDSIPSESVICCYITQR